MKYCIIGAEVIGNVIAHEIVNQNIGDVLVLKKESRRAMHTSGRNSNSLHILNAVSPGFTASLTFVKYVFEKYIKSK